MVLSRCSAVKKPDQCERQSHAAVDEYVSHNCGLRRRRECKLLNHSPEGQSLISVLCRYKQHTGTASIKWMKI